MTAANTPRSTLKLTTSFMDRKGEKKMENKKVDVQYLSKETLICYLLNELGNHGTWEVTTHLGDHGEWIGKIDIRFAEGRKNEDLEYFKSIANIEYN